MLKIEFHCDNCAHGSGRIADDLLSIICKRCSHVEALEYPLTLQSHEPKMKLRQFTAIDPKGNRIEGAGVSYFAKKHKLSTTTVLACLKDPNKTHQGWSFIDKGLLHFHNNEDRNKACKA